MREKKCCVHYKLREKKLLFLSTKTVKHLKLLPELDGRVVGGENYFNFLCFIINLLFHAHRPLSLNTKQVQTFLQKYPYVTRLMTRAVAKERTKDRLNVEGITAVQTHDHPQVRTALTQRRSNAEHVRAASLDALHERAQTILNDCTFFDLIPVLIKEGTLETVSKVLTLFPQH